MEPFSMKCQKCGETSVIAMHLSEGEEIEIKEGGPAPSTICICGAVQPIEPGRYQGTPDGTIRLG